MKKRNSTIDSFFQRKYDLSSGVEAQSSTPSAEEPPLKSPRIESKKPADDPQEDIIGSLERDPGLRRQIWEYPLSQQDEIRRHYFSAGPYRGVGIFPLSKQGTDRQRRFQPSWFQHFGSWLEYSPTKDAAFCLPCYLFNTAKHRDTFTSEGFRNWKKVTSGAQCAFRKHEGNSSTSSHMFAYEKCLALMDQRQHIDKALSQQDDREIANNRLRLETSIFSVRWLTLQGCALRGNDESNASNNRGNFIEIIKAFSFYSKEVKGVVLEKAPRNASLTSPDIQKEILFCLSKQVKRKICEEIGDAKFCILADEARDISKKEQMAVVLRFADREGFVRERFFGLLHVLDTTTTTLRDGIYSLLKAHGLGVSNIRGQGYDGASNMRGALKGLQALISNDSPSAYYVHCMAHRLQLALVGASQDVVSVHHFFDEITFIINVASASSKRSDQLKAAKSSEVEHLIATGEIETGTGLNQIGSLQRAGDTRWGSHLKSITSLLNMFSPTCEVLISLTEEGSNSTQRADADKAYVFLISFQFIFILHLMKEILEITNLLCQALQRKSQDIVNAIHLVSSTNDLLQKLRETGWDALLAKVKLFCEKRNIDIPDMTAPYKRRVPSRHSQAQLTFEHHYKVDIFIATIDCQMQELNNRFNENTVNLLVLSTALDPRDNYASFDIEKICKLASQFYPQDFSEQEQKVLKGQLEHYIRDLPRCQEFKNLSSLSELCQMLMRTRKSIIYPLVDKLIRLVLTLPVSTATTERAFSAMSIVKTDLRNKMEDDYLSNYLMVYIEREIAQNLSLESTAREFASMKDRRLRFF